MTVVMVVIVVMSVMFIGNCNGCVVNGGDNYSDYVHIYFGGHTVDAYYTSEATINAMFRHLASHKKLPYHIKKYLRKQPHRFVLTKSELVHYKLTFEMG